MTSFPVFVQTFPGAAALNSRPVNGQQLMVATVHRGSDHIYEEKRAATNVYFISLLNLLIIF